jgi:Cysteine-rich secretory protein family
VRLRLLLVVAAALLVGCGGGEERPEAPAQRAAQAPEELSGGTAATVLEGRLGDATTASDEGEEEVAPGGEIDPEAAQPTDKQREGVGAGSSCAQVEQVPAASNDAAVQSAVLCLINGVQATDMVNRGYFSHQSPDGRNSTARIRAAGYMRSGGRWTVGENLAWGAGELSSARGLVNAWMNSPPHRANIVKPAYREIGIAIAMGTPKEGREAPGATVATTFGAIRR